MPWLMAKKEKPLECNCVAVPRLVLLNSFFSLIQSLCMAFYFAVQTEAHFWYVKHTLLIKALYTSVFIYNAFWKLVKLCYQIAIQKIKSCFHLLHS